MDNQELNERQERVVKLIAFASLIASVWFVIWCANKVVNMIFKFL